MEELRQAYKNRALDTHPDRGGTSEAFDKVRKAFELLARRPVEPV